MRWTVGCTTGIDDELVTKEEDGSLTFLKGGTADFDTYFNSFSMGNGGNIRFLRRFS